MLRYHLFMLQALVPKTSYRGCRLFQTGAWSGAFSPSSPSEMWTWERGWRLGYEWAPSLSWPSISKKAYRSVADSPMLGTTKWSTASILKVRNYRWTDVQSLIDDASYFGPLLRKTANADNFVLSERERAGVGEGEKEKEKRKKKKKKRKRKE